jgi:hypothetical protein
MTSQRQFTNGKLLRSCYAFLVLPFAPRVLAAVDLAKTEHPHPLGSSVSDNFATDFDLGGHGSLSRRRRQLDDDARLGSSADEHGRLLQLRESGVTNRHSRTAGSAQNFHLDIKLLCKRVHK